MDDPGDTQLWGIAGGQAHFFSGIAIAIGGLITYYISFNALFIIMGIIQATATIMQSRILFLKKESRSNEVTESDN